ncbi:MAG: hypothetical protein OEO23_03845 [Gemmatimonadota bacterium]|nr:hypothetical protein [Gemmatimonadota bacterium]
MAPWLVMAGKGGVGTTTVTALLAVEAGLQGLSTLAVDGSFGSPSLHRSFGILDGHEGLPSLENRGRQPEELLLAATHNVWLLPAGDHAVRDPVLGQGGRAGVYRRAQGVFGQFDLVLVDAGSTLDSIIPAVELDPAGACLLMEPDRTAMAGAYALMKVMADRCPTMPLIPVFNRTHLEQAEDLYNAMNGATVRFMGARLVAASHFPKLPALASGAPVSAGALSDEGAEAARHILSRLRRPARASA